MTLRNPASRALYANCAALVVVLLGGCAVLPRDGDFDPVRSSIVAREPSGRDVAPTSTPRDAQEVQALLQERFAKPLSMDDAVELALLNNPGLQAFYGEVGIASANLVQAGRLPNPRFSFSRLAGAGTLEIERQVVFELVSVFTRPLLQTVERGRLAHAQLQAALEALKVAAEARRAYVAAVASAELVRYAAQVLDAAEISAELARRMTEAGNASRLGHLREQAFYAEATAQLARAQHNAVAERERLVRILGLPNDAQLHLPDRLPDLPAVPRSIEDAQAGAAVGRLDLQIARTAFDNTASSLGLVRTTRFISVFEAGYQNKSEADAARANGYTLELEVPLFDWGTAKLAKAQALYRQAAFRLAEATTNAASEVRTSYHAYRTAYDLARHYQDEIVPLRRKIAEENLLRYNGMLLGVFELIADAREQVTSVTGALQAKRDFWLADAELRLALTGGSPALSPIVAPRTDAGGGSSPAAH